MDPRTLLALAVTASMVAVIAGLLYLGTRRQR